MPIASPSVAGTFPPSARTKEAIASLALLKVQWDRRGTSYIDNFLPFVRHAIGQRRMPSSQRTRYRPRSSATLVSASRSRLFARCELMLLARGGCRIDHRTFVRTEGNGDDPEFDRQRQQIADDHHSLVEDLIAFAGTHGRLWSEDQASTALLGAIAHGRDEFLAHSSSRLVLPRISSQLNDTYVAAQFVNAALEDGNANGNRLDRLFRGSYWHMPCTCPMQVKRIAVFVTLASSLTRPF